MVFALWAEILLAEDGAGDIIIYEKQSWVTLMRVSALFFNLFPFFFLAFWVLEIRILSICDYQCFLVKHMSEKFTRLGCSLKL